MYKILMGIPEMEKLWNDLLKKNRTFKATKEEIRLYKKLGNTFSKLSMNPKYPSLNSHEIIQLSERYGEKVFESYVENDTPGAMRIFWVYGPYKNEITIIGLEPHPNTKSNSYVKIKLSKKRN